jgi:hypothetical protein
LPDVSSSNVLHRLIYYSTFSPTFPAELEQQDEEIANIVRASILNDGKLGLTGCCWRTRIGSSKSWRAPRTG